MDKYDYKLKTEQMLELMEDGAYRQAAEIADTIDWKRVRNTGMLANVSEIYEKNKEYQKGYDILSLAYRRAEGSRKVISRLCTLAVKTGNVDEAIDYYDDFVQLAPKDPNQYILRYQILRAQRAPIEQQIEALEEYKKSEYIEEWAYELAKLYQEAGMTAECLEECDDLILWFSEGQYVYKAMELKMQYKPLTPSQQEKYDRRYEKLSAETEEMPDIISYAEAKNAEADMFDEDVSEEDSEDMEDGDADENVNGEDEVMPEQDAEESENTEENAVIEEAPKKKIIGDTMPLDEALRRLLGPEREDVLSQDADEEEPELDDLADEIGEIESVVDMDIVAQIADERKKAALAAGEMTEITPEETQDIMVADAEELFPEDEDMAAFEGAEEIEEELEEEAGESIAEEELTDEGAEDIIENDVKTTREDDDQITGQMSLEDILAGWEGAPEADVGSDEAEEDLFAADLQDDDEDIFAADAEELDEDLFEADEPEADEDIIEDIFEEGEPESEKDISETGEPEEAEAILETDAEEADDIDISEGETSGDNMETKKTTAPILPPDIQRMIDEIEGVIPPEEEKPAKPIKRTLERKPEEPLENMGKVAESLRIDGDDFDGEEYFGEEELPEDEGEYFDEGETFNASEEYPEKDELLEDNEEYFDEGETLEDEEDYFDEDAALEDEGEYFDEGESLEDAEEEYFGEDEELVDEAPDFEEEFRVNPEHAEQEDDREIPDDDDDDMDILSATTPLSRKETAKLIATGKTAPLPLNEISDALSMSDTGFIVHGRYDLEMQSGIGTRAGLTEEQKKLFSYFVPVRGMSEQLVDVLEQDKNCTNRKGTSKSGNLLIIGNKGNGKTVLAVDVVKAIQRQRDIKQGKVAIVTGDSLNKKKISDIFDKLYGGALIIEKAGKMNEKTVARLNKEMEKDTGELLIVLEEQRKPLDRLLSSNREFRRKFTSRLEIPILINDELVTFGQTYAQENGYRIDEMGILALYSKIDSLQREDHAVTVAEVKAIMDEAIQHSQKASAKKLMKRVFGKNTDEADRIILSEKDFNI